MNLPDEPSLEEKLKDLEAEIHKTTPLIEGKTPEESPVITLVNKFQAWLQKIPPGWRIVLIGGSVLAAFSVLNVVLKLVSALISLSILVALIYFGYRLLTNSSKK